MGWIDIGPLGGSDRFRSFERSGTQFDAVPPQNITASSDATYRARPMASRNQADRVMSLRGWPSRKEYWWLSQAKVMGLGLDCFADSTGLVPQLLA